MEIGVAFPRDGLKNDPAAMREFAVAAESLGYTHISLGDHVIGRAGLQDTGRPIICIATGTGFAPVKSMVEYLIRRDSTRAVRFYWSGRHAQDLYMRELPEKWARKLPWFDFVPVLTASDASWSGRKGLVHRAVLEDVPDLSTYQVYACGNPLMIRKARADFTREGGLPEDQFFAEPFRKLM